MSVSRKAAWTPEARAKMSAWSRSQVASPATRAKISAARRHDLVEQRFGRLVVLSQEGRDSKVRCDCGAEKTVASHRLVVGQTRSCGCLSAELSSIRNRTHGATGTTTYQTWNAMHRRCTNPKARDYPYYGGRGITLCERWQTFENFRADMGERPDSLTLDRIDNDGDYEPGNCRWATRLQQTRNRRCSVGKP
jgi:hypothetical protein